MEWFLIPIKEKYTDFKTRARRKEFWMFNLYAFIISVALSIIDMVLGFTSIISGLFSLALLVPSLAITVRRLHDVNKSGLYFLLLLLPVIGWIWLIILLVKEGDQGSNKYGSDPKNPVSELNDIGVAE